MDQNNVSTLYFKDGRETPGQRYQRAVNAAKRLISAPSAQEKEAVLRENAGLLKLKEVGPAAVQDNRFLSNLSVQYANDELIGLLLMPDIPAPNLSGQYPTYNRRDRLGVPDDSMAGRSTANEVRDTRGKGTYNCVPRALKHHVDVITLKNQVAPLDEMIDLTQALDDDIALAREQRIATVMTTSSNYSSSNVQTIASGSRWDDAGGGNPVLNIQTAIASLWTGKGPGKLYGWTSLEVWNALSRNPQILDLFKYGGTAPGLATPQMVAGFFGLDGIFVSKARNDTANSGQAANYSRVWGKNPNTGNTSFFGVTRVSDRASMRNAAFGLTIRFGQVMTRVWFDPHISTEGGYWAQVSTHEDHNIQANDTAALLVSPTNAG